MSFNPSIYKSVPQVKDGAGSTVISSVNPNYTRLSIMGFIGSNTGFVGQVGRVTLVDATHINIINGTIRTLIEEFLSVNFRQPFQYGTVIIPSGATTGTFAHGLTLGSKAYVVWLGQTTTRAADPGGLALTEAQVQAEVKINGANIQADCGQIDYPAAPGTVTVGYCLIDPR